MNTTDSATAPTLTVSQLNRQVKRLIEGHFDFVWVSGEISNLARPSSGHWYFTLKDSAAQVRCAMFRNRNQRLRFSPGQGDEVRARCKVSLYEGRGEYQLVVEHLEPAGAGALQLAFEALKARLLAEGLFESEHKRPLPDSINRIGVVTSASGAAIHDILTVLRRRSPAIAVDIFPVPVQGTGSAALIAEAIRRANQWHKAGSIYLDALIVGRGGGSLEDLWAFNEELVARAIAASELPVVSAVGHEVDFTIADMVADHRAPTPSAAAEMLSPDGAEQQLELAALQRTLASLVTRRLKVEATAVRHLSQRLRHPGERLREQAQRVDDQEQRLLRVQRNLLDRHAQRLKSLALRVDAASPVAALRQRQSETARLANQLAVSMRLQIALKRRGLDHVSTLLQSVSPQQVLDRGYAIIRNEEGAVISRASMAKQGEQLSAITGRGELLVTVDAVEPD